LPQSLVRRLFISSPTRHGALVPSCRREAMPCHVTVQPGPARWHCLFSQAVRQVPSWRPHGDPWRRRTRLAPPQLRIALHHLLVSGGTAGTCSLRRVWLRHCMPCPAHVQSQTTRCDTTAMCLASKSLCRWPRCASPVSERAVKAAATHRASAQCTKRGSETRRRATPG